MILSDRTSVFRFFSLFIAIASMFFLSACIDSEEEEVATPKPRAYYSLTFPEKKYTTFKSDCPFSFQAPEYAKVELNTARNAEPCWYNVKFPLFKADLYLSYKPVTGNLPKYLEDAHELAIRHQVKASGLEQQVILRDSAKVYGVLYNIEGNTATALQFYLTDSTRNFLRGSLYFNCPPNIDSLKIVIDYLRKDVLQMIQTFKWEDHKAVKPN